jgi:hypothetical protein
MGGVFFDLRKEELTGRQYMRPWFCGNCENAALGRAETAAAHLCDLLEQDPAKP